MAGNRPETIPEPARRTTVRGTFDVLVAGGGLAGVAAAVAAARMGARVALLERGFALGGLATLGNVAVWLPLCDGRGRQVTGGLAEELLRLSTADLERDDRRAGLSRVPACWEPGGDPDQRTRQRFLTRFCPTSYLLALELWVLEAGVELLYDTRVCAVRRGGDRLSHLIIENKDGRGALACGAVVDATGDADVAWLAGEATESLDTNVLAGWFYELRDDGPRLHALSRAFSEVAEREGAEGPFFRGDDAAQVTAQLVGSRQLIRAKLAELRRANPTAGVRPMLVPTLPGFRMTRRLVGRATLTDAARHTWCADAVGLFSDWRRAGPVWALPLSCLLASRTANLLAAGRCLSADTSVWDVTRALPCVALSGQAAGTAAALAARAGGDLDAIPTAQVQEALRRAGTILSASLLTEHPPG